MKLKYTWIVFILSILTLVPIKTYIAIKGNDFVIGSIASNTSLSIFIIVTIILVLAIIIMSLFSKNVIATIDMPKNIFCGIFALLSGISMITSGIFDFLSLSYNMDAKIVVSAIFIVLSGVIFIFIANIHFTGKNMFVPMPLLSLLPTIWACVRLMVLFLYHSSVVSGNIDMFDIIASMFLILFFFSHAKAMAYVPGKKLLQKLFAYGMSAVIILVLYNVPVLCTMKSTDEFSAMYLVDISLILYIVSLLITLSTSKNIEAPQEEYQMYRNRTK